MSAQFWHSLRTLPQAEQFNLFKKSLQKKMYMKSRSYYIDLLVHNEHFTVFLPILLVGSEEITYLHIS
jgi:hypothetical protein